MTSSQISLLQQNERQARRLGMCTLDPVESGRHFAAAADLREMIAAEKGPRLVLGASGTKGSCAPRPW